MELIYLKECRKDDYEEITIQIANEGEIVNQINKPGVYFDADLYNETGKLKVVTKENLEIRAEKERITKYRPTLKVRKRKKSFVKTLVSNTYITITKAHHIFSKQYPKYDVFDIIEFIQIYPNFANALRYIELDEAKQLVKEGHIDLDEVKFLPKTSNKRKL